MVVKIRREKEKFKLTRTKKKEVKNMSNDNAASKCNETYDRTPDKRNKDIETLKRNIKCRLQLKIPVSVAFPPCSDVLLSHVRITGADGKLIKDDITDYFDEYFKFEEHKIFTGPLDNKVDLNLLNCTQRWFPLVDCSTEGCIEHSQKFPPPWCLPPSCVTLEGKRGISERVEKGEEKPIIKRLFIADIIWLFYFERLGIFKILGVILDDFATKGKFPISNGVVNPEIDDDLIAIILEAMVRQTKTGLSSTVRDRDSSYRRSLGWKSDVGRKLSLETAVNTAFHNLFHKFIQVALEFYKDKRLAAAIQAQTTPSLFPGKPSVATLITISDTIDVLKNAFKPFDYGRNYSNTLSGIVWVIAGMALIRELRTTLGIPQNYNTPDQYIPAVYDLLVLGRTVTPSEINRYMIHRECAKDARDILLELEVLDHKDTEPGGELEIWLDHVESRIEGYRTAYRSLTGVDLGAPGTPTIEQAV